MTTEVKYTVWNVHPGRGHRPHIVAEETHSFPNPNNETCLKAAGKKYCELMTKWNGPKWEGQFIFNPRRVKYKVEYSY